MTSLLKGVAMDGAIDLDVSVAFGLGDASVDAA